VNGYVQLDRYYTANWHDRGNNNGKEEEDVWGLGYIDNLIERDRYRNADGQSNHADRFWAQQMRITTSRASSTTPAMVQERLSTTRTAIHHPSKKTTGPPTRHQRYGLDWRLTSRATATSR